MTKEELLNAIDEVNEQLEEIRKLYEPYVGKHLDSLSDEEHDIFHKLSAVTLQLIRAKSDLRYKAITDFGIFVM